MLSIDESSPRVTVFHQATNAYKYNDPDKDSLDAQFTPGRILLVRGDTGNYALVARQGSDTALRVEDEPLSVETWQFPKRLRQLPVASVDSGKELLYVGFDAVFGASSAGSGTQSSTRLFTRIPACKSGGGYYEPVVEGKKWVYFADRIRHRVSRNSGRVEILANAPLPFEYSFQYYAESAHFGMVGWNIGERTYRIEVLPKALPLRESYPTGSYSFVPESSRNAHRNAALQIQKLGGAVDAVWGSKAHDVPYLTGINLTQPFDPGWRTIVYLPSDWEGGDAGIVHLANLHNVSAIFIHTRNCTDETLRLIGQQQNLESLFLINTSCTDDGLRHLSGLNHLSCLRLQSSNRGGGFTDDALGHVAQISSLTDLQLCGSGFTNKGLASMESQPTGLRSVLHTQTRFTAKGDKTIKQKRPKSFKFQNRDWTYFEEGQFAR